MPSADAVDAVPAEDVPELLGALRPIEAQLWRRMLTESGERTPTGDEPLLTVPEAAKLLAFPESYVRELTRKGELPCVRNGKYVRVDPADVRAWTQRHRDREVDPGPSLLYAGRRGRLRSQRRASPSEVN